MKKKPINKMFEPKTPFVAVDIIVTRKINEEDYVLLIERKNPPLGWALPGGFVERGESLKSAAARELKEETNLDVDNIDNLFYMNAFVNPDRDPRMHVI